MAQLNIRRFIVTVDIQAELEVQDHEGYMVITLGESESRGDLEAALFKAAGDAKAAAHKTLVEPQRKRRGSTD